MGFIACGGGAVIDALARAASLRWPIDLVGVLTDRPCGAEAIADRWRIERSQVPQAPLATWSIRAAHTLAAWRPDVVLLLHLRRVGPEIWRDMKNVRVWNLHPSLLPAFRGIGALTRNFDEAARAATEGAVVPLGVTLHSVTDELDAGPIIAQRSFTFNEAPTFLHAGHLAYLQKVELVLDAIANLLHTPRSAREFVAGIAEPWATELLAGHSETAQR